jgi:hypothetical protein
MSNLDRQTLEQLEVILLFSFIISALLAMIFFTAAIILVNQGFEILCFFGSIIATVFSFYTQSLLKKINNELKRI